jgi:hypothetical protein
MTNPKEKFPDSWHDTPKNREHWEQMKRNTGWCLRRVYYIQSLDTAGALYEFNSGSSSAVGCNSVA